jgi:hypothetical protein
LDIKILLLNYTGLLIQVAAYGLIDPRANMNQLPGFTPYGHLVVGSIYLAALNGSLGSFIALTIFLI